jgi:hypothetical protein
MGVENMNMKMMCRKMAMFDAQARLNRIPGHLSIFRESDFTPEEMAEVNKAAERVRQTFEACNGKPWGDALRAIHSVLPDLWLGFKAQDQVIEICRKNRILFS